MRLNDEFITLFGEIFAKYTFFWPHEIKSRENFSDEGKLDLKIVLFCKQFIFTS